MNGRASVYGALLGTKITALNSLLGLIYSIYSKGYRSSLTRVLALAHATSHDGETQ